LKLLAASVKTKLQYLREGGYHDLKPDQAVVSDPVIRGLYHQEHIQRQRSLSSFCDWFDDGFAWSFTVHMQKALQLKQRLQTHLGYPTCNYRDLTPRTHCFKHCVFPSFCYEKGLWGGEGGTELDLRNTSYGSTIEKRD
jgi:hypothetical protein